MTAAFVQACNDQAIGNIAAHSGVMSAPFTVFTLYPTKKRARRNHFKTYGDAKEFFTKQEAEHGERFHIVDNIMRATILTR